MTSSTAGVRRALCLFAVLLLPAAAAIGLDDETALVQGPPQLARAGGGLEQLEHTEDASDTDDRPKRVKQAEARAAAGAKERKERQQREFEKKQKGAEMKVQHDKEMLAKAAKAQTSPQVARAGHIEDKERNERLQESLKKKVKGEEKKLLHDQEMLVKAIKDTYGTEAAKATGDEERKERQQKSLERKQTGAEEKLQHDQEMLAARAPKSPQLARAGGGLEQRAHTTDVADTDDRPKRVKHAEYLAAIGAKERKVRRQKGLERRQKGAEKKVQHDQDMLAKAAKAQTSQDK